MLKATIVSLCSLYELSSGSSRMLLQTPPLPGVTAPPVIPAVPAIPAIPATPQPLPIVPEPVIPAGTTAAPVIPAVPQPAQTTTTTAVPVVPAATTTTTAPIAQGTTTSAAPVAPATTTTTVAPVAPGTTTTTAPVAPGTTTTTAVPVAPATTTTTVAPVAPATTTTTTVMPTTTTTTTTTTTAAPTTTAPPPDGFQYGAFGQLCAIPTPGTTVAGAPPAAPTTRENQCLVATDTLTDLDTGRVFCTLPGDCCMCSSIECGIGVEPCSRFRVGAAGVFGVKDITVVGDANANSPGTSIECNSVDACREAVFEASDVFEIECGADGACRDTVFRITDPKPHFSIDCSGAAACNGLTLEILFSGPPEGMMCNPAPEIANRETILNGIECNGVGACEGIDVIIDNAGCGKVILDTLDCLQHSACDGAVFNFIGNVDIKNCQCGPSCDNALGLEKCFANLDYLVCSDPLSCAESNKKLTNPAQDFELICGNVQSCENANFLLELSPDPTVTVGTFWKGFKFGGENSGRGVTVTIDNQLGEVLAIELLECGGAQSCSGATFITGYDVSIGEVKCGAGACFGCTIKATEAEAGVACDPNQVTSPEVIQTLQPVQSTSGAPVAPAAPIVSLPSQFLPVPQSQTSTQAGPALVV